MQSKYCSFLHVYESVTILFQKRIIPERNIISFQMTGTLLRMQNVVEIRQEEGRRMIGNKRERRRGAWKDVREKGKK